MKKIMKNSIAVLGLSVIMAGNAAAVDFEFENVSNVTAGMTMAEVSSTLGVEKQEVDYKGEVHWVYSETEERFGPDLEKSATIVFNDKGNVEKVFKDEGGFGIWALTSLVFLGLIFI